MLWDFLIKNLKKTVSLSSFMSSAGKNVDPIIRDLFIGNGDQQGLDLDSGGITEACWCLSSSDIRVLTEI